MVRGETPVSAASVRPETLKVLLLFRFASSKRHRNARLAPTPISAARPLPKNMFGIFEKLPISTCKARFLPFAQNRGSIGSSLITLCNFRFADHRAASHFGRAELALP
jgi:hypothetical protein